MSSIPQSSSQGALLELVARGQKDSFFTIDNPESEWVLNANYNHCAPFLSERRTIVPLQATRFGAISEFEIDKYGDVLTDCAFVIDLPTWLPPLPVTISGETFDPAIANGRYNIQVDGSSPAVTYGYTNYIGYFLFESIQLYQDQILLQEWSGDSLFCTQVTEGSWSTSFLDQTLAGMSNSDDPAIAKELLAKRATPERLRVKIPLPGMQTPGDGGLPLCCLPSQNYRIKIKLRPLEDLVECSDDLVIKPAPWNVPAFSYSVSATDPLQKVVFKPLSRIQIGEPTILLETIQAYLPEPSRRNLQDRLITIPYRRVFENVFTIGELDYKPLDVGGTAAINRRLDARHLAERIVFIFRTDCAIMRNRLWDFRNPFTNVPTLDQGGAFFTNVKLVIAGRDREVYNNSAVWRDFEALAKDERDNGLNINEMRWNLGAVYERDAPYSRQPEGSINFSTADRPTIYAQLYNVPTTPRTGGRLVDFRVFVDSWCVYEVQEGRGRQLFAS